MQDRLPGKILTTQEVCEKLRRSTRTLRRWRLEGRLPAVRFRKSNRLVLGFEESKVLELIECDLPEDHDLEGQLAQAGVVLKGRAKGVIARLKIASRQELAQLDLKDLKQQQGIGRKTLAELKAAQQWAANDQEG